MAAQPYMLAGSAQHVDCTQFLAVLSSDSERPCSGHFVTLMHLNSSCLAVTVLISFKQLLHS